MFLAVTVGCSPSTTVETETAAATTSQAAPSASSPSTDACFTVAAPADWVQKTMPQCGLTLSWPSGGIGISVDSEPIDAEILRGLVAEKYQDVTVAERTVDGQQVLVASGSVPGAVYIVVQARSAKGDQVGYYAQGLTQDPAQIPQIERVLASIRMTK